MSTRSIAANPHTTPLSLHDEFRSDRGTFRAFLRRMFKRTLPRIGFAIVSVFVVAALLAPWISPYDPIKPDFYAAKQAPNSEHWLGTDDIGRDLLSRLLYGARVSIFAAFFPLSISVLGGVILGLLAGTQRGWTESIIMRIVDAMLAFPPLILMIAIAGILGRNLTNALIAIGIAGIGTFARIVHGKTLSVREFDFVLAARALGASAYRRMLVHILPNVLALIIVQASLSLGRIVLAEATLSFLGLGVQPPDPSWGSMVARGNRFIQTEPWISLVPGTAIFLFIFAVNMVGDGIRDAMDPYLESR